MTAERSLRPLSCFKLMRPGNGAIAFTSVLATSVIMMRSFQFSPAVLRGALAAAMILGAGNALNDYFDLEVDSLNRPNRALPSGAVSRPGALAFSIILFAGGIGLSWTLPPDARAIAVLNANVLVLYARYSKRMLIAANVLVAALTASVFLFTGAILHQIDDKIIVLAVSAFFSMLAREVLKDIEDLPGDRRSGAATIATRWGIKRARTISTVSLIAAVLPLFFPPLIAAMGIRYLILAALAAAIIVLSLFFPPAKAQRIVKGATLVVLLAFLAGSL